MNLRLFNVVLLALGAIQASWAVAHYFPRTAGPVWRTLEGWGYGALLAPSLALGCLMCVVGAYSYGARFRAFALAMTIANNATLAIFAIVVLGASQAAMGCIISMLLAVYLALIIASHVNPE